MNPFQTVAAVPYSATQAPQPPNHHELVRATQEFTTWVSSVMPNSRAFLSGGLALFLYGNGRHTTVSPDRSLCFNLNILKTKTH